MEWEKRKCREEKKKDAITKKKGEKGTATTMKKEKKRYSKREKGKGEKESKKSKKSKNTSLLLPHQPTSIKKKKK